MKNQNVDLHVIYEDSAADPKTALSVMQKLVNADKIDVVIAGPGSSANLAVVPFVKEKEIMFIALSATPTLNEAGPYIFKIIPDIDEEMILSASEFRKKGYNTVSLIYDSAADSNIKGKDIFVEEFKKNGGKEVFVEGYDNRITNDFRTIFTKAKGQNSDAVYFLGTDIVAGVAIPQARQIGITKPLFGWSASDSELFLKQAKESAEGFILSTFPFSCDNYEPAAQFCKTYMEKYEGRKPLHYGAHAYDLMTIFGKALAEESDLPQKTLLMNTLTNKTYEGTTGTLRFDAEGNVTNRDFVYRVVKDGKFVTVE